MSVLSNKIILHWKFTIEENYLQRDEIAVTTESIRNENTVVYEQ